MKKILIIVYLLVISLIVTAQSEMDCFHPYFLQTMPDSATMRNLRKRDQDFYNGLKGCKAPEFDAVTLKGDTLSLKNLKGKVVVINFWFIECAACIAEIPDLNKLAEEYKSKKVVFIAMGRNTQSEITNDFLPKHKFNFNITTDCKKIAEDYCVLAWPATFIIDKKGKVAGAFEGNGKVVKTDTTDFHYKMKKVLDDAL